MSKESNENGLCPKTLGLVSLIVENLKKSGMTREQITYYESNNSLLVSDLHELNYERTVDSFPSPKQQLYLNWIWNREFNLGLTDKDFSDARKELERANKTNTTFFLIPTIKGKGIVEYYKIATRNLFGDSIVENVVKSLTRKTSEERSFLTWHTFNNESFSHVYEAKNIAAAEYLPIRDGVERFIEIAYLSYTKEFLDKAESLSQINVSIDGLDKTNLPSVASPWLQIFQGYGSVQKGYSMHI